MLPKAFVSTTAACAVLLAMPASGLAAKRKPRPAIRTLTGQVAGSTLPFGSRIAVPVILDGVSVRRARARGPLALLRVPRGARVRIPGSRRVALAALRAGDLFRARLPVPAAARRAAYPAFNVGAGAFRVTRRGAALSAAELQEQILVLQGYVGALAGYVIAQFADLRGQVSALRGDVSGLQSAVAALQAKLAALPPTR